MKKRTNSRKKKLLTVSQFASRVGVTRQAIRKAIVEKRLKYHAYKIGHNWVIEA